MESQPLRDDGHPGFVLAADRSWFKGFELSATVLEVKFTGLLPGLVVGFVGGEPGGFLGGATYRSRLSSIIKSTRCADTPFFFCAKEKVLRVAVGVL